MTKTTKIILLSTGGLILGVGAFLGVRYIIRNRKKKREQEQARLLANMPITPSPSSTGTNTSTNTGTTSTGTTSTGTISNLTKTQKIDTLVKSMRNDPTETDMDKFHYDFFNKLSDSELNTWMVLSKALKDASVQQEMQKGKESGYNYLKSKYGLLAGDVDNAMNKYGQALSQLF